jgi:hypothetical protein
MNSININYAASKICPTTNLNKRRYAANVGGRGKGGGQIYHTPSRIKENNSVRLHTVQGKPEYASVSTHMLALHCKGENRICYCQ